MAEGRAGDVFVEHDTGLIDRLIQFGEHLRHGRGSEWNHAGVMAGPYSVIEAEGRGVARSTIVGRDVRIIPVEPASARQAVVDYASRRVGRRYGWLEDVCLGLALVTGGRLRFGIKGEYICSGLVGGALTFAGVDLGDDPEWSTPGDIGSHDSFTANP